MGAWRLHTLGFKIAAGYIILVLLTSVFILFYFPWKMENRIRQSFEGETAMLAKSCALAIGVGLSNDDFASVEIVTAWLRQYPGMQAVVVLDTPRRNMASFPENAQLPVALRVGLTRNDTSIDYCTPVSVSNELFGYLCISRSLAEMRQRIEHGRRNIAAVSLVLFLIGILLSLLTSSAAVKPLRRLQEATARIAQGDYQPVDLPKVKGEIGDLVSHFNAMAEQIHLRSEELLKANEELKNEVVQRRKAEEEAGRARDLALEQTHLKSEFLANMSHEIRTPMNGVLGYLGLLADRAFAGEQEMAEFVRGAKSSAESLLGLINDILDFSKVEAGKMTLELIPFDLRSVVEEAADLVAPRVTQKGLELASLVESGVPVAVVGDPTRLRQVLLNLASNAVKFTERGEVVIRAALVNETATEAKIRFSVRDTGIGIPFEKRHLIFRIFTQLDGSSTRRHGGTGLGLAICKQLVELMGGEIDFKSDPGRGSEFWFEITLAKNLSGQPMLAGIDIQGLSVLVVDDNAVNRDVLCRMVETFGCRPTGASQASEAMAILNKRMAQGDPVRLAILDFQMPGEDGEQLARKIRSHPAFRDIKLVLLTSMGYRGDAARAQEAGFAAYLTKPVKQSLLMDTIATVMARTGQDAEKSSGPALITRRWIEEARGSASILLAEDNPVNQAVAKAVLAKCGYSVVEASNGKRALELLKERNFDLVLMDVQMPEMDGLEAAQEIRNMEGPKAKIPIIAMTAHALSGDREQCLKAGMDDYITKPISPAKLTHTVKRWLGKQGSPHKTGRVAVRTQTNESVDLAHLAKVTGESRSFERELTELFLADGQTHIQNISRWLSEEETEQLAAEAHSLKGAASNFGAFGLAQLCERLEAESPVGDFKKLKDTLDEIKRNFEQVKSFMLSRLSARSQAQAK